MILAEVTCPPLPEAVLADGFRDIDKALRAARSMPGGWAPMEPRGLKLPEKHRARLDQWSIDEQLLCSIASDLLGRPTAFRSEPAFDRPTVGSIWVRYPPASGLWQLSPELVEARRRLGASPGLFACAVYCAVLLRHPFMDGNGRTARLLVADVPCAGRAFKPSQPLESAFQRFRPGLVDALRHLGLAGDWEPIVAQFRHVLATALAR